METKPLSLSIPNISVKPPSLASSPQLHKFKLYRRQANVSVVAPSLQPKKSSHKLILLKKDLNMNFLL